MTFVSPSYALFLASMLVLYWVIPRERWRLWILLVASLLFYSMQWVGGAPQFAYIPLLIVSILINFYLGRALGENSPLWAQAQNPKLSHKQWEYAQVDWSYKRLQLLWLGITLNVALLIAFKYLPFLLSTIAFLFRWPWAYTAADVLETTLIPPLGLSFFTFECIAYLVDIYRGAPATPSLLNFAAYKFFFPKLISGPITGYHMVAKQLRSIRFPVLNQVTEGLWLIGLGAFKKAVVADHLGILVDLSYSNLPRAGSGDIWLATIAYGLQLYLDFSGYVDMARGTAVLFGVTLPENFNAPYFSTNIADFWRRWHMTLGNWLRNYLYFPMGGSRRGLRRTCQNLFLIMLIAGIWHGASWGFVVWGALHGLALVAHRLTEVASQKQQWLQTWWESTLGTLTAWGITQITVFSVWLFFRLPTLREAWWAISHLFGKVADPQFAQKVYLDVSGLDRSQVSTLILLLVLIMAGLYGFQRGLRLQLNWPVKLVLVPLCFYAVLQLAPQGGLPYIYFDF